MRTLVFWLGGFAFAATMVLLGPLEHMIDRATAHGFFGERLHTLLMVPLGVMTIVFLRLIVGLETFGLFAPLILSFAFYRISPLLGVGLFLVVLALVLPFGMLLARFPLLSTARTGAQLILCALLLVVAAAYMPGFSAHGHVVDFGMPVVAMAGIMDRFVSAQLDQSPQEAIKLSVYTLLVSVLVSTGIVGNQALGALIRDKPDLLFLCFPLTLLIGRYSGLRLLELVRFRSMVGGTSLGAE